MDTSGGAAVVRAILGEEAQYDAVRTYAAEVGSLRSDIVDLYSEIADVTVGVTGVRAHRRLRPLEVRHARFLERLLELRDAADRGSLDGLPWLEVNAGSPADRSFRAYLQRIDSVIDELEARITRAGQLLRNKRSAATSRIAVCLSVLAVGISSVSAFPP